MSNGSNETQHCETWRSMFTLISEEGKNCMHWDSFSSVNVCSTFGVLCDVLTMNVCHSILRADGFVYVFTKCRQLDAGPVLVSHAHVHSKHTKKLLLLLLFVISVFHSYTYAFQLRFGTRFLMRFIYVHISSETHTKENIQSKWFSAYAHTDARMSFARIHTDVPFNALLFSHWGKAAITSLHSQLWHLVMNVYWLNYH